jgi:hypothetical protein
MKKSAIFLGKLAGIAATALLLGTSAFADSRSFFATVSGADQGRDYDRRVDRHDVSIEGRVTNITRERGGYRVTLDRGGYSFWVRDLYAGRRGHGALHVGINIRIGGVYEPRYGYVIADTYDWLDEVPVAPVYRGTLIRGAIERIDRRAGMMSLRVEGGRLIDVDMTRNDRHWNRDRGIDLGDLHRGDRVTLAGSWTRRDLFLVEHVESVRSGRY